MLAGTGVLLKAYCTGKERWFQCVRKTVS